MGMAYPSDSLRTDGISTNCPSSCSRTDLVSTNYYVPPRIGNRASRRKAKRQELRNKKKRILPQPVRYVYPNR